ncbi:MAG: AAA family ATPase [Coriobacteriia bacterium]
MDDGLNPAVQMAAQLENFGINVRRAVLHKEIVKPYARPKLTARVVSLLAGGDCVLLRGDSGVGKTELARSAAFVNWPEDPDPGQLPLFEDTGRYAHIIEVTPSDFILGCRWAHDLENKISFVFQQIRRKGAILFVDCLDECIGAGSSSSDPYSDVASLLTHQIETGALVIGAVTYAGDARLRLEAPRLHSRFTIMDVPPPDASETLKIVRRELRLLAASGVKCDDSLAETAIETAARYLPGETAVRGATRLCRGAAADNARVTPADLRVQAARELGVDARFTGVGRPPRFDSVCKELARDVFGQEEAVAAVAEALIRFATGMCEPKRPIATFLFVGPSGCGKTTLALAAAKTLTGDEDSVIRFDMSEYSDPWAPRRLTSDNEDSLVSRLIARPAGVLLLDEIEKAHPLVFNLLLQAIGESRITSESGHSARLDTHLIVMTSNIGSHRWSSRVSAEAARRGVLADCAEVFPPEFRGRLTRTVVFAPIGSAVTSRIVERELARLGRMPGLAERGLQLTWPPELVTALCVYGSREKGARSIQQVVQGLVATPLAKWLAEQPDVRDGLVVLAPGVTGGRLESLTIDWVGDRAAGLGVLH